MSNIVQYNSQDIMAEFDTYYAEDYRAYGQLYPVMAQDLRFYLGDQWTLEEKQALRDEGRHFFTVNKVKAKIDWVNGWEIQNRTSPLVLPIQSMSQQAADDLTEVLLYVFDKNNGYRMCSETFSAGNKTGWSLLNVYFDYNSDPVNGDICFGRDPYSGFILSAYLTKLDLSDCDHLIKRKYIAPSVAATLLPGQEDEVMSLARDGWERDNKFTWMVFQRVPTGQRMMAYNEFYRVKYQPQKVIVNLHTGQFIDWDGSKETYQYIQRLAEEQGHPLEIISRQRKYIEKHIVLNNYYMRTEINPYGLNEYPCGLYAPIFETESEEYSYKVQSLIRQEIDVGRERNRRRSQLIDVVESQLNSGWIEEDGAVKNPKMLYQSGQGRRIVLNKDYKRDSIDRIQPAVVPPSYFQELQLIDQDELDILGMNRTSFGMEDSKQVSALVEMHRQKAGLIGLETVFDRYSEFKSGIATKVAKMIQQWHPSKLRQILGRDPSPELFEKDLCKYHVTTIEGIYTPTQKYLYFRQVLELQQLGEPIPPGEITKLAPLQGKSEFIKDVEKYAQSQQQMMQQQQQQAAMHEQALADSLKAKAIRDLKSGQESATRSISNLGLEDERVARSVRDREEAALAHVKGLKELEMMDTEHQASRDGRLMNMFRQFMDYQGYLKDQERQEKEQNALMSSFQDPANKPPG